MSAGTGLEVCEGFYFVANGHARPAQENAQGEDEIRWLFLFWRARFESDHQGKFSVDERGQVGPIEYGESDRMEAIGCCQDEAEESRG